MAMTADNVTKAADLIRQRSDVQHHMQRLKEAFDGDIDGVRVVVSVIALGSQSKVVEVALDNSEDQAALFEVLRLSINARLDMIEAELERIGVEV